MTFEKSADILEMAGQVQEAINAQGRAAAANALVPQVPKGCVTLHCHGCGDDMDPERAALGRNQCVLCQTEIEQALKQRGGR